MSTPFDQGGSEAAEAVVSLADWLTAPGRVTDADLVAFVSVLRGDAETAERLLDLIHQTAVAERARERRATVERWLADPGRPNISGTELDASLDAERGRDA